MIKRIVLLVIAVTLCVETKAALYESPFNPGSVSDPHDGIINDTGFSDSRDVTGFLYMTDTVSLILKFTGNEGLNANPTDTMSGVLTLRNGGTELGHYTLSGLSSYTHPDAYYYITANSIANFTGLNPNNTWSLALGMDSGSSLENTLVSWSLSITDDGITPVPEPVEWALIIFAGLVGFLKFVLPRLRPALAPVLISRSVRT